MKTSLYPSLLLYLSFIFEIKSPTATASPCKLFPKILGGILEDTYPIAIDANLAKDIIVLIGETYDSSLSGITGRLTFVASFSIKSSRIYWAKADTMNWFYPNSISLSPNAKYVAVFLYHNELIF